MSDESASDAAEDTSRASEDDEATGDGAPIEGESDDVTENEPSDADIGEDSSNDDDVEEAEIDDAETGPSADAIQETDFVRVSFTARTQESDQLVDTTDPEVAEEAGVDPEQETFEPRVIPIGAGHLFPSVEDSFIGKDVGDTATIDVPATEAFGEYDPDNVRTVSVDAIPEDNRYPGAQVEIEGESGHVERVIGGRARVDFNHPLAGEAIEYEYEILERVEDPIEQAEGMLHPIVDIDLEIWIQTDEVEEVVVESDEESDEDSADEEAEPETELVEKRTLYIESVPQMAMNQRWLFSKRQVAQDLIDRLELDRVIIQETIEDMGGLFGDLDAGEEIEDVAAAIEDIDLDEEGEGDADEQPEDDEE